MDWVTLAGQSSIPAYAGTNQQSAIALVIPGDWLSTAAYPILVDPIVWRWQTNPAFMTERSPAIAYDAANNRALVAYARTGGLYTRLVNAEDGTVLHQTQLSAAACTTDPSTIFSFVQAGGQNEYRVACGQGDYVSYWRVNANGYPEGDPIPPLATVSQLKSVDIAATGDGAGLVVWSTDAEVWGRRISLDGTPQGNAFAISTGNTNPTAAVAYDVALGQYVVVWQRMTSPGNSDIYAATVSTSGSVGTAFQVSDAPVSEWQADVAYSTSAGKTLVVWSSNEADGKPAIKASRGFFRENPHNGKFHKPVLMM